MTRVLDILGSLLWFAFCALGVLGVGLCVAFFEAALDARTPPSDAQMQAKRARGRALRRYVLYWLALATVCVMLFVGLAVSRGA